jgi:hypothetical protein
MLSLVVFLALLLVIALVGWHWTAHTLGLYRTETSAAAVRYEELQAKAMHQLRELAQLERESKEREERHATERAAWAEAAAAERQRLFDAHRQDVAVLVDNLAAALHSGAPVAAPVAITALEDGPRRTVEDQQELEARQPIASDLEAALAQREKMWRDDPEGPEGDFPTSPLAEVELA